MPRPIERSATRFATCSANLAGFDADADEVPVEAMEEIDVWALHQLEALRALVVSAYESHQYHLVYHGLNAFVTVTLSSFYLDVLKDRLYTFSPCVDRKTLRADRALQDRLGGRAPGGTDPVLHRRKEIWQELEALQGRPRWGSASVHAQVFPAPSSLPHDPDLLARWDGWQGSARSS
jgi:isoleucyl-tRNA synthetase